MKRNGDRDHSALFEKLKGILEEKSSQNHSALLEELQPIFLNGKKSDHSELLEDLQTDQICQITGDIFYIPVLLPCCGNSCEQSALRQHIAQSKVCPLCGTEKNHEEFFHATRNINLMKNIEKFLNKKAIKYEDIYLCFDRIVEDLVNTKGKIFPREKDHKNNDKENVDENRFKTILWDVLKNDLNDNKSPPLPLYFLSLLAKKTSQIELKTLLTAPLSAIKKFAHIKEETIPSSIIEFAKLPGGIELLNKFPFMFEFASENEIKEIIDFLEQEEGRESLNIYPQLLIELFNRLSQQTWRQYKKNQPFLIFLLLSNNAGQAWIEKYPAEFHSMMKDIASAPQILNILKENFSIALYLLFTITGREWAEKNEDLLTTILKGQTKTTLNMHVPQVGSIALWLLLRFPKVICKYPETFIQIYSQLDQTTIEATETINRKKESINLLVKKIPKSQCENWNSEQIAIFNSKILPALKKFEKSKKQPPSSQQSFVWERKDKDDRNDRDDKKRKFGPLTPFNKKQNTK